MSDEEESGRLEAPSPNPDTNARAERHLEFPDVNRLKMNKSRAKATFTRHKNVLVQHLEEPDSRLFSSAIKATNIKLDDALETAMNSIHELYDYYSYVDDRTSLHQVAQDMETLEREYAETVNFVQEFFRENRSIRSETSSVVSDHLASSVESQDDSESWYELPSSQNSPAARARPQESEPSSMDSQSSQLGQDLWKQMIRVSIPVFIGDKTKYDSWKAAFMARIKPRPPKNTNFYRTGSM